MKLKNFEEFAETMSSNLEKEEIEKWVKMFIGDEKPFGESIEEILMFRKTSVERLLIWLNVEVNERTIGTIGDIVVLNDHDCPECGGEFDLNREKTTSDNDVWTCRYCNKTYIEKNEEYEIKD